MGINSITSNEEEKDFEFQNKENFDDSDMDMYEEELKDLEKVEVKDSDFVGNWESYRYLLRDLDQQGYNTIFTREEEIECVLAAQSGSKKHKDEMVLRNIRLVVKVAKRYVGFSTNVSLGDLIDEGVIGLMRAVERFDVNKGFKFSTYALYWIEQAITRSLECADTIRIPVHVYTGYYKYRKFLKQYVSEHGFFPNEEECIAFCKTNKISYDNMKWVADNKVIPSLNQVVSNEGEENTELGDFIKDDSKYSNFDKIIENQALRKDLIAAMDLLLNELDKEILLRRFGFYGRRETLEEIGSSKHLTRERVRQREEHALRKLRFSYRTNLKQWTDTVR